MVSATVPGCNLLLGLRASQRQAAQPIPYLILVPLDSTLAQQAAEVAAQHRLRGSDAVYAAVALRFGSPLVTLDREQRERIAKVLVTSTPADVLKTLTN